MKRDSITQEYVKELFYYHEEGYLTWKVTKGAVKKGKQITKIPKGIGRYIDVQIDGCKYSVHQIIWLFHKGYFPEHEVDHIDRDIYNNRIENLREVTHQCNTRNRSLPVTNKTGITGVCWCNTNKKYMVQIGYEGHRRHLGLFDSIIEAACHRLAAEQCLQFPSCIDGPAYNFVKSA